MTTILRTVAGVAGRVIGVAASYGLSALFPSHESTDRYWDEATKRCAEKSSGAGDELENLTSAVETERPANTECAAPSAAERPARDELRAHTCAGHPNLTGDELGDAARAVRSYILTLTSEVHIESWDRLAEKLETAALSK
jgi:hypothetical protein